MLFWIRDSNSEKFRFKSFIIKIVASEVNNYVALNKTRNVVEK